MESLPKGIRKRGDSYQAIVSRHSRQYSASFKSLEEAVKWREEQVKTLRTDEKTEKNTRTLTLEIAVEKTISIRWEGTKAERTSVLNARGLVRFFGPNTKLTDITTKEVERLIESQKTEGNSNATINRKLACLSVILKTAEDLGYQTSNPRLIRRKEYKGRDIFLTEEQEQIMLNLFDSWSKPVHKLIFLILLDTGMRMGECLNLKAQDIDFVQGKQGVITLWETKNNRPRSVPMSKRLSEAIVRHVERLLPTERLFTITPDGFRAVWDRMRSILGEDDNPQFVPHILRHTCASRLVKKGVPLVMVQKWLGHLSITSTMRYSHLAPEALYDFAD